MTLRGCFLILISGNFPVTLAPLGRSYPHSVFAVRRKNTMVSGQVDSGFGYQGGQFGDEIYWALPRKNLRSESSYMSCQALTGRIFADREECATDHSALFLHNVVSFRLLIFMDCFP